LLSLREKHLRHFDVDAGIKKKFPSAVYLAYFDVFSTTIALQINIKSLGLDLQALAHEFFIPCVMKTQNNSKISARKSREYKLISNGHGHKNVKLASLIEDLPNTTATNAA
jgi:hypothetical protein